MLSIVDCKVVARPNASFTPEATIKLLLVISAFLLLISVFFMRMGAWLVLPFAGLELMALTAAFHYVNRHAKDFESITIDHDRVVVEKRYDKDLSCQEFQRYWTQVNVRESLGGRSALYIGSHGKEVEFGKYLIDDAQRLEVMRELRQQLKQY